LFVIVPECIAEEARRGEKILTAENFFRLRKLKTKRAKNNSTRKNGCAPKLVDEKVTRNWGLRKKQRRAQPQTEMNTKFLKIISNINERYSNRNPRN
jgi:hypothetical protein